MDPVQEDIRIQRGADFYWKRTFTDEDDVALAVTDASVFVYDTYGDSRSSLVTLTPDYTTGGASGILYITAAKAVTEAIVVDAGTDEIITDWGFWHLDVTLTIDGSPRIVRTHYGRAELQRTLEVPAT